MRNPVMVGERVYLRPIESADAETMARDWNGETDLMMHRGRVPVSPIAFETMIAEMFPSPLGMPPAQISFGVCLRGEPEPDRLIGLVNLEGIDWVSRTAETGSGINVPSLRGQGYGTEAKHLLLEYAFERLHLRVLMSHVWEPNTRSAAALMKQGYRFAGRITWDELRHGVFRDGLLFDVTREDWLAAREEWRASRAEGSH